MADTLCRKVSAFGHATSATYGRRTRLYHLCAKQLYAALGQADNRHRRPTDSCYVRGKVMGFDYVLLHPQYRFLPTEQDKLAYFCEERGVSKAHLPTKVYTGSHEARTERYFVDKYPLRVDPATGKWRSVTSTMGVHAARIPALAASIRAVDPRAGGG